MQLIILSAGIGSRLRPYTNNKPKCLVKVGGKPILERQLEIIKQCGINKKSISIVGGYLCDRLRKYNLNVIENKNFNSTNMVYSLFLGLKNLKIEEDLIISYGDIIYEKKVLQKLVNSNFPISVVADKAWSKLWDLRMENVLEDAETFKYDSKLNILELGRKTNSINEIEAQYIGLIKVKKEFLKKVKDIYEGFYKNNSSEKESLKNMYMTSFLEVLIERNIPVKACLIESGWLEVDTKKDLEIYNQLDDKKKLDRFCRLI